MTTPQLLWTGSEAAPLVVVLAHGAGAPMDTPFMNYFAEGLAAQGRAVARFEFPYMAARRQDGVRRAPDRQPTLIATWNAVIAALEGRRLVIGGKSMGGRIASMVADASPALGLLCLGYPFFAAGKKDANRVAHMAKLQKPALICQGTRDPLGPKPEVEKLDLAPSIRVCWLEDGDHDLKPRKASGLTHNQNLTTALDAASSFLAALA